MAERSKGWTLWSRSGYRGPSELNPHDDPVAAATPSAPVAPASAAPPPVPARAPVRPRAGRTTLVDRIIDERSVHVEFQAIHDADSGQVVAFEALSRGPEGPLRSPLE